MTASAAGWLGLPTSADAGFVATSYDLTLDYRVATNRIDAVAIVAGRATTTLATITLSFAGLRVSEVLVDGRRPARWRHRSGLLSISTNNHIAPEADFEVTVRYGGMPRPITGPWGEVGWEELADGVLVAGQPDGARSWFPCLDTPAGKAPFRMTVTAESPYFVLCNGALVSRTQRSGRQRWVYEMSDPMAPYLATVQVGRYGAGVIADAPVTQSLVAPPARREAAMRDLAVQPRMMDLFCSAFGPYPFDAYTVLVTDDPLEIPVEAQGLSVFGSNHLDGTGSWERLVAHELAHQWFGNSVTVGQWRDIWLHEGFACYAEWLWSEQAGAQTAHEHAVAAHERLDGLAQDLIIGDPDAERMFDDRLYKRGALTLHALRITVGDDVFFDTLRAWAAENRHRTVSTELFVETCERVSGMALGELFGPWLGTEALPDLPIAPTVSESKRAADDVAAPATASSRRSWLRRRPPAG